MVLNCNSTYTFGSNIKTFIIKPDNATEIVCLFYFYNRKELLLAACECHHLKIRALCGLTIWY